MFYVCTYPEVHKKHHLQNIQFLDAIGFSVNISHVSLMLVVVSSSIIIVVSK